MQSLFLTSQYDFNLSLMTSSVESFLPVNGPRTAPAQDNNKTCIANVFLIRSTSSVTGYIIIVHIKPVQLVYA